MTDHSGRDNKPDRRSARAGTVLAVPLLLLATLAAAPEALAVSGEPNLTSGLHFVPEAVCEQLRTESDTNGDLYFVCNADRAADIEGRQPCDLVYGTNDIVRGDTFGFCEQRFAGRDVRVEEPDATVVETEKLVRATLFGANTGIVRNGDRDVFCTSFAGTDALGAGATQGTRACVEIFKTSGTPGGPASCAGLTISNNQTSCNNIEAQLEASLTAGADPVFSHVLFLQVLQNLGTPGSQALFVCKGYSWSCADETAATQVKETYPFGFFESPGCGMTRSGYRCW